MKTIMEDIILKNFDKPDEIRKFDKGKFEIVKVANMTIGRATYLVGNGLLIFPTSRYRVL